MPASSATISLDLKAVYQELCDKCRQKLRKRVEKQLADKLLT